MSVEVMLVLVEVLEVSIHNTLTSSSSLDHLPNISDSFILCIISYRLTGIKVFKIC